jgi:transcriptional regulator with XRE-family HTH domain
MSFVDKLRVARGYADMPRSWVADCLCVDDAELERWESGQGHPRSSHLCQIADLYRVSVEWLMCPCTGEPDHHEGECAAGQARRNGNWK